MRGLNAYLALAVLVAVLALLLLGGEDVSLFGVSAEQLGYIAPSLALLIWIMMGSGIIRDNRMKDIILAIVFWGGLGLALMLGYTLFAG